jgi:hypothetical protein
MSRTTASFAFVLRDARHEATRHASEATMVEPNTNVRVMSSTGSMILHAAHAYVR